jgi:hypothetical protein
MHMAMSNLDRETRLRKAQFGAFRRYPVISDSGKNHLEPDLVQIRAPERKTVVEKHGLGNSHPQLAGFLIGARLAIALS